MRVAVGDLFAIGWVEAAGQEAQVSDDNESLSGYAGVIGIYGTVAGGLLALAIRRRLLPERISSADLVLFGVASHKVARTITKDKVTRPLRAPFTEHVGAGGPAEVAEEAKPGAAKRVVGELLSCPFCLDQWISTGFVFGSVFAPRPTRAVASVFAVRAVADWLQLGYGAMQRLAEGPPTNPFPPSPEGASAGAPALDRQKRGDGPGDAARRDN